MKNIIVLAVFFIIGFQLNAQTAEYIGTADNFSEKVAEGVFQIIMPENTQSSEIERTSAYYTDYFTIEYDENERMVTVTMVQNDAQSRRVINRFLLSNGVKEISFDGNTFNINSFFNQHLSQD